MKISVDDVELFIISDDQENIIKDYVNSDIFDTDMKRRLQWIINEIYNQSYKRLRNRWYPILVAEEAEDIPEDPIEFAQLIFARQDYKDKKARDEESVGE